MKRSMDWSIIILIAAVGISLMVATDSQSPIRAPLAFAFLLVCPGMAFVQLLRIRHLLVELTLAVALSIALSTLVSGIMVYARIWSPQWALYTLAGLSLIGVMICFLLSPAQRYLEEDDEEEKTSG